MNVKDAGTSLSDVLYEFSLARPLPDAEILDQFVRRYPEHAKALTDLAIEIVLDAGRGDADAARSCEPGVSKAVSRAMSRFQNKRFEVLQGKEAVVRIPPPNLLSNPFEKLDREAFRTLARRINGNTVLIGMLRDREIEPKTIPKRFTRRVAEEMGVPPELLAAHFFGQTEMPRGQFYKAEAKPGVGAQLSFEAAVRKSGLSEEQQEYLLNL
jgi:hypothetical protein